MFSNVHSKMSKVAATDIMSDIPLLCEGVMGIGIFMFLVLVKKVCRLSLFLHASSFLTFVAATLDLSRVVAGGDTNVYAFFIAREVLLSLAYPLLYLYLWELVAKCPRSEANPVKKKRKRHSADWDRWGFPGEALKWVSLAALLAVPALQLLWRLLPTERQHSAIYVADSILQTTLSFGFIIKFVFNAHGSLSTPFWQAIRPNVAPILTLLINLTLSIGNILFFVFADSVLGRFLHAVGVYILLLYNLYTSFQELVDSTLLSSKRQHKPFISSPQFYGKENAWTTVLDQKYRPFRSKSQRSYLAEKPTPQQDIGTEKPVGLPSNKAVSTASDKVYSIPSLWADDDRDRSSSLAVVPTYNQPSPSSSAFDFYTTRASTVIRPDSSVLTSCICYVQDAQQVATLSPDVSSMPEGLESTVLDMPQDSDGSETRLSLCSLDKILRHRDEVDKSIAQLSSLYSTLYGDFNALDPLPSDVAASSTPSNNSLFSLSVFPEPPSNLKDLLDAVDSSRVDTLITFRPSDQASFEIRRKRINEFQPLRISGNSILLPEMLRPGGSLRSGTFESTSTQWDVTSFIGHLMTDPTNASPMYTEGGVGPAFPRTYSQLLVLGPAERESLARIDESGPVGRVNEADELGR